MSSLFIDRKGVILELESDAIVFREKGERIGTVPIAPISRIFMRGDIQLSASLLGKLGEHNIGVVILSGKQGKPSLLLARPHNDASRRVAQISKSLDQAFCLSYAITLIEQKIARQIAWFDEMRANNIQARYELTHAKKLLQEHIAKLKSAQNLGTLRGLEGSAANIYFDGLKAVVPESLHFKSRNRRPPRDPFNALLSLTYTLAHAEIAIALYGVGLDPYIGFYHQLEFGRESLASDLLESVRQIADQFCLQLFKKQMLTSEHFSTSETSCLLGKAGRAKYYAAYEENSEALRKEIQNQVENLSLQICPKQTNTITETEF